MLSGARVAFQRFHLGMLLLLAWPGQPVESRAQGGVPQPPQFLVQPMSLILLAGSDASFSVVMHDSTVLLTYAWRDFDAYVLGGTSPTLTISNVRPTQIGIYSVVVTNVTASVTSSPPAYLTVVSGPYPWKQAVPPGMDVTFSVSVHGVPDSGPVDFQWHFKGSDLPGATDGTLTLTNVQPSDAGGYSCTVTNAAGAVTTREAMLRLAADPPRLSCLRWGSNGVGFNVIGSPDVTYVIQATKDFKDWIDLSTNTAPASGTFEFNDPDAFTVDWRWYRALQP